MLYFIQNDLNKIDLNKTDLSKMYREGKTYFRVEGKYVYWKRKRVNSLGRTL